MIYLSKYFVIIQISIGGRSSSIDPDFIDRVIVYLEKLYLKFGHCLTR